MVPDRLAPKASRGPAPLIVDGQQRAQPLARLGQGEWFTGQQKYLAYKPRGDAALRLS